MEQTTITLVLETYGKRDSIDRFKIITFDAHWKAEEYCEKHNDNESKYYTHCEIVKENYVYSFGDKKYMP